MSKESEGSQLSLDFLLRQNLRDRSPENTKDQQAAREAMFETMGDLGSHMRWLFNCIEIAEDEIYSAEKEYPYKVDEIWNRFSYLWPSPLLHIQNLKIYRAHAREMIKRIAKGQTKKKELQDATSAELCCVFSEASFTSPLSPDLATAYEKVFSEVFPDEPIIKEFEYRESYQGRADQIISKLRRKYRQPRQPM